jgi:hypothetical protein
MTYDMAVRTHLLPVVPNPLADCCIYISAFVMSHGTDTPKQVSGHSHTLYTRCQQQQHHQQQQQQQCLAPSPLPVHTGLE